LRWAKRNAGPSAKKPKDKAKEVKSEAEKNDSQQGRLDTMMPGNLQM